MEEYLEKVLGSQVKEDCMVARCLDQVQKGKVLLERASTMEDREVKEGELAEDTRPVHPCPGHPLETGQTQRASSWTAS